MSELQFLKVVLEGRLAEARASERGVSAVEWVLITGVLVLLVGAIVAILIPRIQGKAESINLD